VPAPQRQSSSVIARIGIPIVTIAVLTPTASRVNSTTSHAVPSGSPVAT